MKTLFEMQIMGDVPPKKNMYKISGGRMYKDARVDEYTNDVWKQIKAKYPSILMISEPVWVEAHFYYGRNKDIDNLCNGLFDTLQACGVIKSDMLIEELDARKERAEGQPYTIVRIHPLVDYD